jgi:hypothetical protein
MVYKQPDGRLAVWSQSKGDFVMLGVSKELVVAFMEGVAMESARREAERDLEVLRRKSEATKRKEWLLLVKRVVTLVADKLSRTGTAVLNGVAIAWAGDGSVVAGGKAYESVDQAVGYILEGK